MCDGESSTHTASITRCDRNWPKGVLISRERHRIPFHFHHITCQKAISRLDSSEIHSALYETPFRYIKLEPWGLIVARILVSWCLVTPCYRHFIQAIVASPYMWHWLTVRASSGLRPTTMNSSPHTVRKSACEKQNMPNRRGRHCWQGIPGWVRMGSQDTFRCVGVPMMLFLHTYENRAVHCAFITTKHDVKLLELVSISHFFVTTTHQTTRKNDLIHLHCCF